MNQCSRHGIGPGMMLMCILLASSFYVGGSCPHHESRNLSEKTPLYIGGMFSMSGGWDGSGALVAAELALEQINNRSDILEDYELKMIWHDTQCDAGKASRAMFDLLVNKPEKIILLGPACSTAAAVTVQTSQYWNLLSVLTSATATSLSNREKYPNVYRTCPLSVDFNNKPILWMMKEYNWLKIASTQDGVDTFNSDANVLTNEAAKFNADVVILTITKNVKNQVERLRDENVKIITTFAFEDGARRLFCQAYKIGLYGEDMFWVVPNWYREKWWLVEDDDTECSTEELAEIVETSLALAIDPSSVSLQDKATVSGLKPAEFLTTMETRLKWSRYKGLTMNNFMGYTFDAVWTIGLMLNKTSIILQQAYGKCLEDFVSSKDGFYGVFFDELARTNFFGASGDVTFSNGERLGNSQVFQLRGHCHLGWHLKGRFCYKFRDDVKVSWKQAVAICENDIAQLTGRPFARDTNYKSLRELWLSVGNTNETKWHIGYRNQSGEYSTDLSNGTSTSKQTEESENCPHVAFDSKMASFEDGSCIEEKPFLCMYKADFYNVPIAVHMSQTDEMTWIDRIIWPGGEITKDGTTETQITTTYNELLLSAHIHVILVSASACGIVLITACSIFLLHKRKFLETTSGLDWLIIFSSLVIFISVIPTKSEIMRPLTDEKQLLVCQIHGWLSSVGVILGVSTLVGKMWLIYKATTLDEQATYYTAQSYILIAVCSLVDVACLILLHTIFPLQIERITKGAEMNATNPTHVTESFVQSCSHGDSIIPIFLSYMDKVTILLVGSFLSYEVKQASLTQIEHSQSVSVSIYNILLFGGCGLVLKFLLTNDPITADVFCAILVLCCTIITVLILFLPRIVFEIRNRDTVDQRENDEKLSPASSVPSRKSTTDMIKLQRRNEEQEELIGENKRLKNEYQRLRSLLPRKSHQSTESE